MSIPEVRGKGGPGPNGLDGAEIADGVSWP